MGLVDYISLQPNKKKLTSKYDEEFALQQLPAFVKQLQKFL